MLSHTLPASSSADLLPSPPTNDNSDNASVQEVVIGLSGLPHHLLPEMKTNVGVSVAELSQKHVVLLVFLRYFGCVFCQKSVVEIVNSLSSLIKLNCVPVFVHQETTEEADVFFSEMGMPRPLRRDDEKNPTQIMSSSGHADIVKKFLRVADPENKYYKAFGVKSSSAGDIKGNINVVLETMRLALTEGYSPVKGPTETASRTQMAATFVAAKGKIVNQLLLDKVTTIPDFLEVLLDVDGKSSDNIYDLLEKSNMVKEEQVVNSATLEVQQMFPVLPKWSKPVTETKKENKETSKFSCFSAPREATESSKDMTLQEILADTHIRKIFKCFAAKIYAVESILFWEQVSLYQKVKYDDQRQILADSIIKTYLDPKSLLEINTSSAHKTRLFNLLRDEGPVPHLFDDMQKNMELDTLADTYARFIESDMYEVRVLKKKKRN